MPETRETVTGHTPSVTHPITSVVAVPQEPRKQPRSPSLASADHREPLGSLGKSWPPAAFAKPVPWVRKMTRAHLQPLGQGVCTILEHTKVSTPPLATWASPPSPPGWLLARVSPLLRQLQTGAAQGAVLQTGAQQRLRPKLALYQRTCPPGLV